MSYCGGGAGGGRRRGLAVRGLGAAEPEDDGRLCCGGAPPFACACGALLNGVLPAKSSLNGQQLSQRPQQAKPALCRVGNSALTSEGSPTKIQHGVGQHWLSEQSDVGAEAHVAKSVVCTGRKETVTPQPARLAASPKGLTARSPAQQSRTSDALSQTAQTQANAKTIKLTFMFMAEG